MAVPGTVKSKDSLVPKSINGSSSSSSNSSSSNGTNSPSQINLSQIGVKSQSQRDSSSHSHSSHEHKKGTQDAVESLTTAPTPTGSPPVEPIKVPGPKDPKKNTTWQNRGIVLSTDNTPQSQTLTQAQGQGHVRGASSPEGRAISGKTTMTDSNSDDGVGVSNSEVEDEWLEVKQKRAKGPSSSSSRPGPQSTSSYSTSKEPRSRSASPVLSTSHGPDSFAAALTSDRESKKSLRDDREDFPPVSPGGLGPSQTPMSPMPVSTMAFKAAVMGGQQDAVGASPTSHSHPPSPHGQTVPQSLSTHDFPAMPTASTSQRTSAIIPHPPTTNPTASLLSAVAAAASAPAPIIAVQTLAPSVSAAPTADPLLAGSAANKKTAKSKKKALKAEVEAVSDGSKDPLAEALTASTACPVILGATDNAAARAERAVAEMTPTASATAASTSSSTSSSVAVHGDSRVAVNTLQSSIYSKLPVMYQMPPLTPQVPYASQAAQSTYDMHSQELLMRPSTPPIALRQSHSNVRIEHIPPPVDVSSHEYAYQDPLGDEENDDDLFKAISSANAIDFDPSFTANNFARSVNSTLSPLSRRIGSRNGLSAEHEVLPRQVNSGGLLAPYGSSLLDNTSRSSPACPLTSAEGFLSGISFDFFSSLLQSSATDVGPCMLRADGNILELPHHSSEPLPPAPMHPQYPHSLLDSHSSPLESMQLNELSPLCSEYQYRGSLLPDLSDDTYPESDSHSIRYQMPTLIPIPPSELTPVTSYGSAIDMLPSSSLSNNHYGNNGTLDLPLDLPPLPPQMLTARELSLATDNFSATHLLSAAETGILKDLNSKSAQDKLLNEKEKEREKSKEISICTFIGLLRHTQVVIKIITPNSDPEINTILQTQYLRELRVFSEVSHPNILSLYGYTFRPYARVFKIPPGTSALESVYNPDNHGEKFPTGFFYLHSVLCSAGRRSRFSWKIRLRVVICILRALSYLHEGDKETGRSPIAHRYRHNCLYSGLDAISYMST